MSIGISGFGTSGNVVAKAFSRNAIRGAQITAASARDIGRLRICAAEIDDAIRIVPLSKQAFRQPKNIEDRRRRHNGGFARSRGVGSGRIVIF